MLDVIKARWQQGYRTMKWPDGPIPPLPERFAGRPVMQDRDCPADCRRCVEVCPTAAVQIQTTEGRRTTRLDTGRCLFCRACEEACPNGQIRFTQEYRLGAARRKDLMVERGCPAFAPCLVERARRYFGRSLKLREVSAGGCNACEADSNVLGTPAWDMGRFGIQFVASPRHADGLWVTGPVPENMREALLKTYQAIPSPKVVIAVGSCAISGGPYAGCQEVHDGVDGLIPVDLYVPGCPPHPLTILASLLGFVGRHNSPQPRPQE